MGNHHWYLSSVLGRVKYLCGHIVLWVEVYFRFPINGVFTGFYIQFINGFRAIVIGKGEIKIGCLLFSSKTTGTS